MFLEPQCGVIIPCCILPPFPLLPSFPVACGEVSVPIHDPMAKFVVERGEISLWIQVICVPRSIIHACCMCTCSVDVDDAFACVVAPTVSACVSFCSSRSS